MSADEKAELGGRQSEDVFCHNWNRPVLPYEAMPDCLRYQQGHRASIGGEARIAENWVEALLSKAKLFYINCGCVCVCTFICIMLGSLG
jgi:hypothetical protein